MSATFTQSDLDQFYGTEQYHRHFLGLLLSDGVAYLMNNGAGWLVDAIASYQPKLRKNPALQSFQVWELVVKGQKGTLTCRADSGEKPVVTQKIGWTDFPLPSIKLYVCDGVCLLPSEY